MKRVVITGMGAVSPFGQGVGILMESLIEGRSGIIQVPKMSDIEGLRSLVAGLVHDIDSGDIPRKHRRSMSAMSIYATMACQEALQQAGMDSEHCTSGRMGVAIGSTVGSTHTYQEIFSNYLSKRSIEQIKSTVFFKIMNHTCASNVSQVFGITGRCLSPAAACSTSIQAIGYGCEMIAMGKQDYMLCGGADEFHPLVTAAFDIMNAASTNFNEQPQRTPRPFDCARDGVVCSEGSGILLLESLESACKRRACIIGEIIGFATISDPSNIANPDVASIERCMWAALKNAAIKPDEVDYINAHATATVQGDLAESEAIYNVFGSNIPVSSLKGHIGHTMAASGALELIAVFDMMKRSRLIPTRNLDNVDESCNNINHIKKLEAARLCTAMKNNFALGGINSTLLVRKYNNE